MKAIFARTRWVLRMLLSIAAFGVMLNIVLSHFPAPLGKTVPEQVGVGASLPIVGARSKKMIFPGKCNLPSVSDGLYECASVCIIDRRDAGEVAHIRCCCWLKQRLKQEVVEADTENKNVVSCCAGDKTCNALHHVATNRITRIGQLRLLTRRNI